MGIAFGSTYYKQPQSRKKNRENTQFPNSAAKQAQSAANRLPTTATVNVVQNKSQSNTSAKSDKLAMPSDHVNTAAKRNRENTQSVNTAAKSNFNPRTLAPRVQSVETTAPKTAVRPSAGPIAPLTRTDSYSQTMKRNAMNHGTTGHFSGVQINSYTPKPLHNYQPQKKS